MLEGACPPINSANDSALGPFDEFDDLIDLVAWRQFFADRFDGLASIEFGAKKQTKCFLDRLHFFRRVSLSFQSDRINAANLRRISIRDHERRNVLHDFRATSGDGETSDTAELMHSGETAHDGVVAHFYVTSECPVIGKNNFVAHGAIVANMTVGQKISAITDARFAVARCAAIDRDKFAKGILIADLEISRLAFVFQILRLLADRAISVKFIARARAHRPAKRDVMLQPAMFAERHIRSDHAIGSNFASRSDLRAMIDNRSGMNSFSHLSRNVNINSPSERPAL